jgi:hypothetical protein
MQSRGGEKGEEARERERVQQAGAAEAGGYRLTPVVASEKLPPNHSGGKSDIISLGGIVA